MEFDAKLIEAELMRISRVADPAAISETFLSTVDALVDVLAPVIGKRGVAALYERSVHISRRNFAWLPMVETPHESESMLQLLQLRTNDQQAAACAAVLSSFYAILVSLVGSNLSSRLLRDIDLAVPDDVHRRDQKS